MFIADVKCLQAPWQTVPNLQTCSAKTDSFFASNSFSTLALYKFIYYYYL